MDLYIPLPLIGLASVAASIAGLCGGWQACGSRPTAGRWVGGGSLVAGIAWGLIASIAGTPTVAWAGNPVAAEQAQAAAASALPAADGRSPENAPAIRELGVEPTVGVGRATIDHERRPPWVESAPVRVGSRHTTAVSSGPWVSLEECRAALDEKLQQATQEYIAEQVHSKYAGLLASQYDVSTVKTRLYRPENIYEEQVIGDLSGSMYQVHALLEFDDSFRTEIAHRWRHIVMQFRLAQAGIVAVGIVLLLSVAYGLLRADTATRGYYTRVLQFAAAIAILAIIAVGVVLAKSFPWL